MSAFTIDYDLIMKNYKTARNIDSEVFIRGEIEEQVQGLREREIEINTSWKEKNIN